MLFWTSGVAPLAEQTAVCKQNLSHCWQKNKKLFASFDRLQDFCIMLDKMPLTINTLLPTKLVLDQNILLQAATLHFFAFADFAPIEKLYCAFWCCKKSVISFAVVGIGLFWSNRINDCCHSHLSVRRPAIFFLKAVFHLLWKQVHRLVSPSFLQAWCRCAK